MVKATTSRRKYFHLLKALERAGQLRLHAKLTDCFQEGVATRFSVDWVEVTSQVTKVQTVFITPVPPKDGRMSITFDKVVKTLAGEADPVAALLCRYLAKWQCEAGSIAPESL